MVWERVSFIEKSRKRSLVHLLMMGTAFTGARVKCVTRVFVISLQNTSSSIIWLICSLEACCGNVWSCLDFQIINSSGFKGTIGGGVKRFSLALKTSVNCLKALIGAVSRLRKALSFTENRPVNSQAALDSFLS